MIFYTRCWQWFNTFSFIFSVIWSYIKKSIASTIRAIYRSKYDLIRKHVYIVDLFVDVIWPLTKSRPFGFVALTILNYLVFQSFDSERTWWRLFWEYLMKVILSVPDEGYSESTWWRLFWVYLMKVILSVPDEGYSERTWWRLFWAYLWWRLFWEYLMKVILRVPYEGYSERTWWRLFWAYLIKVILSVTWWRLFCKHVVCTKFDIYVFISHLLECPQENVIIQLCIP